MVRARRRAGRLTVMVSLVLGASVILAGPVAASSPHPPPPVLPPAGTPASGDPAGAFADDQPLVVNLGTEGDAEVPVVNSSSTPVDMTLSVTGRAARYVVVPASSTRVPPGVSAIRIDVDAAEAVASTGTLVLTAADGTLERQPLHLVGVTSEVAARQDGALVPGSFDTLSIHRTSFVPSYFRPVPDWREWGLSAAAVAVAAALLLVLYQFVRTSRPVLAVVAGALFVAAVLALLPLVGGAIASGLHDRRDATPVENWSREVQPPAAGLVVADLVGSNGLVGILRVDDSGLTITGLSAAGTYTGNADAWPALDGGDMKASVAVRDWWPYALAAVAIGVGLGALLAWVFAKRPAAQTEVDIAEVRQAIAADESGWQLLTAGDDWSSHYSAAPFLLHHISGIEELAKKDHVKAQSQLDELTTLKKRVSDARTIVLALADDRRRWVEEFTSRGLLSNPLGGWFAAANSPLGLGGLTMPEAKEAVDARIKDLKHAEELAGDARRREGRLIDLRRDILDPAISPVDRELLMTGWRAAAGLLADAANQVALDVVDRSLEFLAEELRDATRDAATPRASVAAQEWGATVPYSGPPARGPTRVLAPDAEEPRHRAPTDERDDLQEVWVDVRTLDPETMVFWRFSDGTRSKPFPVRSTTVRIEHVFIGGPTEVSASLHTAIDGSVLGSWLGGKVRARGRFERLATRFLSDSALIAILAFVVAVGSGMVALYLADDTWGSAGDYVTALLWGAVTAEGIRAVAMFLVNRRLVVPS